MEVNVPRGYTRTVETIGAEMTVDTQGKTGRRPGTVSSKQAILDAARDQFTRNGYKGATLRAIAAQAGIDPALIRHFYGDKDGLFLAAMEMPSEAVHRILAVFSAPDHEWGELLTHSYLSLWEDPATAAPLRATVVSAFSNDQAMDRFLTFVTSTVLEGARPHLPDDDPSLRLSVAMSHLISVAMARHLMKAPPIAARPLDQIVALVAPAIQRYLTDPLPQQLTNTPRAT